MSMFKITHIFIIFCLFIFLFACSLNIPHPPEFEHFEESHLDLEKMTEKEIQSYFKRKEELTKALQFTEKEITVLNATHQSHLIAAIGIQSPTDDPSGRELLELASDMESTKGLATVSLIERYFEIIYENEYNATLTTSLRKYISSLQQNHEDNALSYYLYAYVLQKKKNDREAIKQLHKGNKAKYFHSYSKQRYQAVVEASEMVKYPKFTARVYAMQNFVPTGIYMSLFDLCRNLTASKQSKEARKECLLMGKKIETASRNNIEKLFGLGFQCMGIKENDLESKAEIERKRKEIIDTSFQMSRIPLKAMTEDFWIQYYQHFFEENEESATRFAEEYLKQHGE